MAANHAHPEPKPCLKPPPAPLPPHTTHHNMQTHPRRSGPCPRTTPATRNTPSLRFRTLINTASTPPNSKRPGTTITLPDTQ